MESTSSKTDVLKPVILKAGVPLAVSFAGFIYAWILSKKSLSKAFSSSGTRVNSSETDSQQGITREESYHSLASMEEEVPTPKDTRVLTGTSVLHDYPCFEQEINGLRSRVEDLQLRELVLRLHFNHFCDLKEKESLLMEIRNLLSLESARVDFYDKEISSMEAENKRLETFVVQYLDIIEQLEQWKSENRLLRRKVKKLVRKSEAQSRLGHEQTLIIKAQEKEIIRIRDALRTKINVINKSEDEINEMQRILYELQDEKNELLAKLETPKESSASKIEAENPNEQEYKQLLKELEQQKKERAGEVKELVYLRWNNACLRHELIRMHEQRHQERTQEGDHVELEFEGRGGMIKYESEQELEESPLPGNGAAHSDGASGGCSRRRKLIKRLKRWVEGSEKAKLKAQDKGRPFVSYGTEEHPVPARRSCSSA
ncbi:protein CHUP1, chloroplastic-like isoform X1 [Neltuma alba]|uniref:protein CHUP1, chloroplastic-like isoform X1 n=1 Tax=Neltuma alba TaxID=207710 RepID=UPI0010A4EAAB|nr:protein CHUP1, chloroplastic-like isoform X1 [Prosopis alba]